MGVGWGNLPIVWYVELTSHTADEEVIFFIAEPLVQAQGTGSLGTTVTFLLFPKPKKIMPQLRTTSTTRVREVESNATLTKNAIVHLFV